MPDQNLSFECVDAWRGRIKKEATRIYWIGNYYDSEVYDDTELSAETVDILINKCANVFKELQLKNRPVVLYLPNVLQLPVAVLAALRIGLTILPISATQEDVDSLRVMLSDSNADTIVTVDGFWMGTKLIKTKELLDKAISHTAIRRVLVIRHVSPAEGIPPPQVHLIGRRPYYPYKVSMKENRDFWWSRFFPKASTACDAEQTVDGFTALLSPVKNGPPTSLFSISLKTLESKIDQAVAALRHDELALIISTANIYHQIVCFLAALRIGAVPLIYEGDIRHPDPSRISQIVYTYKVQKLLIAEEDLNILLAYKEYITFWDLQTLKEIVVLGSPKLATEAKEIFAVPCRNMEVVL